LKINPIKTVLTISVGFLFIYLLGKYNWALWISFLVGLTGVFSEKLSVIIEKVWMKLAFVLSKIVPNIILGVIFFVLLFPISLLSKVFRKQDVLKLRNSSDSVYTLKPGAYDKAHFENMW
jgi:cytochrome c oxidase subunit IV